MVKKMKKSRKRTKGMKRRSKGMRRKYSKKMKRRSRRRRSKTMRKRSRRKSSRVRRSKPKRKRSRRRRKMQKGGVLLGGKNGCINPFQGKAAVNSASGGNYYKLNDHHAGDIIRGELSRQLTGSRPMRGGGDILRDLGLTFPKDLYNDTVDYLTNVKNAYTGDRVDHTSDVLKQGISKGEEPSPKLTSYSQKYGQADNESAQIIEEGISGTGGTGGTDDTSGTGGTDDTGGGSGGTDDTGGGSGGTE